MAIWQVEVDGKTYELEGGNRPPSEQQARASLKGFSEPNKFIQSLQRPAAGAIQTMQMLPGAKQWLGMEAEQQRQRDIIYKGLLEARPGRPFGVNVAGEMIGKVGLPMLSPSSVVGIGVLPMMGGKALGAAARHPATRRFMQRQLPTFTKGALQRTPVQPQYRDVRGQRVDITKPLPQQGNVFNVDYITKSLLPKAQQAVKTNIQKFTSGIERYAREKLKISPSAVNTIKTKGVKGIEATRGKLNNNIDNIYQRIIQGVESKRLQADTFYKGVVDKFKGTIDASPFRSQLSRILREKGWIDQTGKPTGRFGAKLDPVLDDLTRLHQDLRTIYKGKAIKGFKIPKEDFMTYRDMLGRLLKDRPSDRSIMQLRNSLYTSAENSGMRGIVEARNLERIANQVEQKLVTKGLVGEKGLNRYHTLTKEQLRNLKEIEYYIQEPFVDDLANLTAAKELDKIYATVSDIPGQGNMLANQLFKATDPRNFNFIKNNLRPFLGEATESIFKDLGRHRFATGLKTVGKWGAGAVGTGIGYSLLRKPVISAIESMGGGGDYGGGGQ